MVIISHHSRLYRHTCSATQYCNRGLAWTRELLAWLETYTVPEEPKV